MERRVGHVYVYIIAVNGNRIMVIYRSQISAHRSTQIHIDIGMIRRFACRTGIPGHKKCNAKAPAFEKSPTL